MDETIMPHMHALLSPQFLRSLTFSSLVTWHRRRERQSPRKFVSLYAAGQAKPSPPVGPALGQAGLKIMDFCKDFNAKTADFKPDVPISVMITAYEDKTFTYVMKSPPATYFIR